MKKCEEFAPLLSAFVDGELTEEERAEVLAHVSECEKCRRLLGELTALHAALGELEDEDVPAGFTGGVMAAVRAEKAAAKPQVKKRSTWRRWMPMAACAAIVALAAAVTIPRTAMKQEAAERCAGRARRTGGSGDVFDGGAAQRSAARYGRRGGISRAAL